jgi:hypothetical protein
MELWIVLVKKQVQFKTYAPDFFPRERLVLYHSRSRHAEALVCEQNHPVFGLNVVSFHRMLSGRRHTQKEPRPHKAATGTESQRQRHFERRHHSNPRRRPSLPIRTRGSLTAARHSRATHELDGAPDGSDSRRLSELPAHCVYCYRMRMATSRLLSALHAFGVGGLPE